MATATAPAYPPKQVSLVFPLRLGPWSEIVRGCCRYAETALWTTSLHTAEDPAVALSGEPDGVIAMVRTRAAATTLATWGGPVVDTAADIDDEPFARVRLDPRAVGRTGAEGLAGLRVRAHAYVGDPATPLGRLTGEAFARYLRHAGRECVLAPAGVFDDPYHSTPATERAAAEWLASLPRPAAVFAPHDAITSRLAVACRVAGLRVPGDIALLGVLNDEFLCLTARPPLSSIAVPLPRVGFEAARVLAGMMAGGPRPPAPIELPPVGLVSRESTDPTAAADPDVRAALRFIRDHTADKIGVDQITSVSGLSRSTLERRFRAAFGHGPLAELLRQRVDRARHLLAETDLPVKEVARATGFTDIRHLSTTFRQKTGASPTAFRARHRPG